MRNIKRKIILSLLTMFMLIGFSFSVVLADDAENRIADKMVTDTHKNWTATFKAPINFDTIKNSIKVKDTSDNSYASVTVVQGGDDKSIVINAPSEGYKLGHTYEIRVDKSIAKSKKGVYLKRTGLMNFTVASSNSANFKVEVSPLLPSFKRITLISVNNEDVKKFKLGNDGSICSLGKPSILMTSSKSTDVYFYADDGVTLLGKGALDISNSSNGEVIQLSK